MKVAKFGGSSLASAQQIKKVSDIIKNDPEIRAVVVSAPGKRDDNDTKVTDLLIALYTNKITNINTDSILDKILKRYQDILEGLGLSNDLLNVFEKTLNKYLDTITDKERLLDALKACGEDFNAMLIAKYLNKCGLNSRYVSPKDLGIYVTDEPGNARLLENSYNSIQKWKNHKDILVIPGFFGYSAAGDIVTFSRGGSDITGAIVARGLDAELYENFTDESYIYSAHPGKVKNPLPIKEITYREMRELAYSGFSIFHDEALEPLYQKNIPVRIRNTNEPDILGTKIVSKRSNTSSLPVVGISADSGFLTITLEQYLLNRQVGYTRKLLSIFEDFGLLIEHVPSGIDHISVVLRSRQFKNRKHLEKVINEIQKRMEPESIKVEEDLAIVMIVGEGMSAEGQAYLATKAFHDNDIHINMINQGASEISMMFAIASKDVDKALNGLHNEIFG